MTISQISTVLMIGIIGDVEIVKIIAKKQVTANLFP